jgi:predicted DNA-binding transcriptional regulator YafY
MRIDRLLSIIVYLLNRDLVSARELAKKYEVTPRTIQRDIEAIDRAGIPIMSVQGPHGGYGIVDTYKMDRQLMTVDDLFYIVTALSGIASSTSNRKIEATAEKIKSLVPERDERIFADKHRKLLVDFSMLSGPYGKPELFEIIEQAIDQTTVLQFGYTNSKLESTERLVEPMTIVFKWRSWYLFAYCRLKSDYRLFRFSRIRSPKPTNERFDRRAMQAEDFLTDSGDWGSEKKVDLVLAFDIKMKPLVEEFFFGNKIEEDDRGRLVVHASMPEDGWVYGLILSYGPSVEVLAPDRIRRIVGEMAANIQQKYKKVI